MTNALTNLEGSWAGCFHCWPRHRRLAFLELCSVFFKQCATHILGTKDNTLMHHVKKAQSHHWKRVNAQFVA
jgi:hypothetical protein